MVAPLLPGLRKVPAQARGWARVDAILDAAAHLFTEQGYESTSMEAIAARAGTSIGSVYQFFEKKQDLFLALAHRALEDVRAVAEELTGPVAEGLEWRQLVELSVDGFVAWGKGSIRLSAVNANLQLYGLFEEADMALSRTLIDRAAQVLLQRLEHLDAEQARRIATMIVNTINTVMFFGSRSTPEEATTMVEEAKRMLVAYVGSYVAP